MSNEFYNPTGNPGTGAQGSSSTMRSEFVALGQAFDKFPALLTNALKKLRINTGGTGVDAVPDGAFSQDFSLTGDITPAQITANQNDYNPTGLSTATVLRLSTDASRNITGLQGGADGRVIVIVNVGAQNIVLADEGAGSAAANRFALFADLTIQPDWMVIVMYDSTVSRWRMAGLQASAFMQTLLDDPDAATARPTLGVPSVESALRKNALIGWDFSKNPAQRGSSFLACASGQFVSDRVKVDYSTTGVVTVESNNADVPTVAQAGKLITASLKVLVTTADAAVAAGDLFLIREVIEGVNFQGLLAQRQFVVSGWIKSNKTGTYCVFAGNDVDRSYCAEITISAANTWEYKKDILFTASPSAGTWNYANGYGLHFGVCLMAGTNNHMAAGAWNSVNKFATANQVNLLDAVNNYINFADWQVEPGTVSTPLEHRSIQETTLLCERYCQLVGAGAVGIADTTTNVGFGITFRQAMRAVPTATIIDTSIRVRYPGNDLTSAGSAQVAFNYGTSGGFFLLNGWAASLTAGQAAPERIGDNFIRLESEL